MTSRPRILSAGALRSGSVLLIGALVMHWVGFVGPRVGEPAGLAAAHGLVLALTPAVVAMSVAIAVVASFMSRAKRSGPHSQTPFEVRAARYGVALVALFVAQELVEVVAAPELADTAVGSVRWLAFPLGILFGAVVAALETGLERVAGGGAKAPIIRVPPPLDSPRGDQRPSAVALATRNLAFGFARRPPPALLTS